jgi:hypothetical protein
MIYLPTARRPSELPFQAAHRGSPVNARTPPSGRARPRSTLLLRSPQHTLSGRRCAAASFLTPPRRNSTKPAPPIPLPPHEASSLSPSLYCQISPKSPLMRNFPRVCPVPRHYYACHFTVKPLSSLPCVSFKRLQAPNHIHRPVLPSVAHKRTLYPRKCQALLIQLPKKLRFILLPHATAQAL